MSKDDKKQPTAKIFRKPIHDKATRKMAALPKLIDQSKRPDGAKASMIEDDAPVSVEIDMNVELSDAGLFDDLFDK